MATDSELLAEALAARHALLTGTMTASVRFADGRAVTYTAANLGQLDSYIAELRASIAGSRRRRTFRLQQSGTGL